jgi:tight adherence protein B
MGPVQIFLIGAIFLIILGTAAIFLIGQEKDRKKRITTVIQGHKSAERKFSAKDVQNKRRAEIAKKLKETKEEEDEKKGKKKKATIALSLEQAGLTTTTKQYWIYALMMMAGMMVLALITGQPPIVIVLAAVVGLLGIPRLVLRHLIKRRQKKFLEEFADALEAVIRVAKSCGCHPRAV